MQKTDMLLLSALVFGHQLFQIEQYPNTPRQKSVERYNPAKHIVTDMQKVISMPYTLPEVREKKMFLLHSPPSPSY